MAKAKPTFGPKQQQSHHPRQVGAGPGMPSTPGNRNSGDDTGLKGKEAATMGRGAKAGGGSNTKREGTEHPEVARKTSLQASGGDVKGQNPTGGSVGGYNPKAPAGGHSGSMHHLGSHGRHESLKGHEHRGYTHSSEDR